MWASACVLKKKPRPTRCETRKREKNATQLCYYVAKRRIHSHHSVRSLVQQGSTDLVCAFSLSPSPFVFQWHSFIRSRSVNASISLSLFLLSLFALLCAFGFLVRLIALTHTFVFRVSFNIFRVEFFVVASNMLSFHFSMGCSSACILYGRLQLLPPLPLLFSSAWLIKRSRILRNNNSNTHSHSHSHIHSNFTHVHPTKPVNLQYITFYKNSI